MVRPGLAVADDCDAILVQYEEGLDRLKELIGLTERTLAAQERSDQIALERTLHAVMVGLD